MIYKRNNFFLEFWGAVTRQILEVTAWNDDLSAPLLSFQNFDKLSN
jgi:hypothetical protein